MSLRHQYRMCSIGAVCAFLLLIASAVSAQTSHSVSLSWTASADAATNPTLFYNVYRAVGPCPVSGSPGTLSKIGSTLALVNTYTDTGVSSSQTYCYIVRATVNGVESPDSNTAQAVVPLAVPANLVITKTQ